MLADFESEPPYEFLDTSAEYSWIKSDFSYQGMHSFMN